MGRFLITGDKGFIGKSLKDELGKYNTIQTYDVADNDTETQFTYDYIFNLLSKYNPDAIFHVGACSDTMEQRVNYMMERNFLVTIAIADWCKINNRPLIYSSSASCYGTNNETPSNLYGWSKYTAEKYVTATGGISLRYFNVYGPGEEHKGNMASVAYQMYVKHKNMEKVKLFPLSPRRDFVYIKDVVHANIFALTHYDDLMETYYDVGSGEAGSFEEVMEHLNIPYTYHPEDMIPSGYQFYTKSNERKWMYNWSPAYTLEKGLQSYKEYLDENFSNRGTV